ncbi:hypothetical protein ACFVYV_45185 [Streptomyces mirabilis]|uniref:hypothetical protein n=1 Tax=Streptomyces mirabilis TaxID=68239 RepID=UPI0036DB3612
MIDFTEILTEPRFSRRRHVLADADFQPFGIAQYDLGTTFKPGSGDPFDGQPL